MAESRTFKGMVWASCQRFGSMIVSFVSNMILARLLTPADFGTVGMLLFFINVSNVFIDSGFGSALIQKKDAGQRDFSTIFYLNFGISTLLYTLLFVSAPAIAEFYHTPILVELLRVEGLVLFGNALGMIQATILRKQMDFKRLALANLSGNISGSVFAVVAAFCGLGVWSLVVRVMCVAFVTTACLWWVSPWRPTRQFSGDSARKLFGYGGYMLVSTGLNAIGSNLQTLIIGRLFNQRVLGFYTQALQLRNVAADSLQNVIGQVIFPDYASLDSDEAIAAKLNRSFYIISFFSCTLLVLMLLVGEPLIVALYSAKWIEATPYFRILCLGGIFYAIQDVNYYVIAAKGRSGLLSLINLCKIPVFIAALYFIGKYCGIYGLLWTIVGYTVVSYLIFALVATRLLCTSVMPQLLSMLKSAGCSVVAGAVMYGCMAVYVPAGNLGQLIYCSCCYMAALGVVSMVCGVQPVKYIINSIFRRRKTQQ